jgi:hypothetical protein
MERAGDDHPRSVRQHAARISTASTIAVAPSHSDALATSISVSWQTNVWNSKIARSVPWLTPAGTACRR